MLKYYPSFRVKTNLNTTGNRLLLNGVPYSGQYYQTYDNKFFSGPNPIIGPSEELKPFEDFGNSDYLNASNLPSSVKNQFLRQTNVTKTQALEPVSYYPNLPKTITLEVILLDILLRRSIVKVSLQKSLLKSTTTL